MLTIYSKTAKEAIYVLKHKLPDNIKIISSEVTLSHGVETKNNSEINLPTFNNKKVNK